LKKVRHHRAPFTQPTDIIEQPHFTVISSSYYIYYQRASNKASMSYKLCFEEISAKDSFSFHNDNILQTRIGDGVSLRIERIGFAVARVYFVDDGFAKVDVPKGFLITDNTNGNIPVLPLRGTNDFFVGWTDNYTLFINGVMVMKLINQRQWVVHGPNERAFAVIDK